MQNAYFILARILEHAIGHCRHDIGVTPEGHIWLNNRRVELNEIRQFVEDTVTENPESSAVVVSDQASPTGVVIDIMDQVRAGGVIDVSIAAVPEST